MRRIQNLKRLVAIGIAGAAIVAAAFAYHYFHSRPVGNGPAGLKISHDAFSKVWSEKEILIVGLGDSVTAGFGARKGYSYFDRLIANPPDEYEEMRGICLRSVLPKLRFMNMAVSGSTSMEHVERQLPRLKAVTNSAAIVVITTGGNDLIHNYGRTPPREEAMYGASWENAQPWIKNFETRLDSMVKSLDLKFPRGCQIFLATIYDPTDGVGDIVHANLPAWPDALKILDAYNNCVRRCAVAHPNVHIVDLHDAFLGHGIHCTQFWRQRYDSHDPHYWYYDNLEDPNERGYDVIRRLFLIEIAKIVPQLSSE